MKNFIDKYEKMEDAVGTALAVFFILLLIPIACALPFLWAWVYQQIWNYGVVWLVAQCGSSVPAIGYWAGMGLYILIRFIRAVFTVKVKKEE